MMPKVDGFEVLAIMNKNKWLEQIPVIIISSETAPAYIDNAYDLGALEYINRPFEPSTVQAPCFQCDYALFQTKAS